MSAELPDMDELLRTSDRRERRRSLQLGTILIAGGTALSLATYGLFNGQLVWVAPSTIVVGVGLFARGLLLRR